MSWILLYCISWCLLPSVCTVLLQRRFCFSLTFQSQAQPPFFRTPLATFSLLSIFHSSFLPTQPWMVQSQRGKKTKQCKNTREKEEEGWGSNHALSYFLNDGDQSGGTGRREEGRIEVFEDRGRRVHGSPDCLILHSHWSVGGGGLDSLMGVWAQDMYDPSRPQPLKQPWQLSSLRTSKPATLISPLKCLEI